MDEKPKTYLLTNIDSKMFKYFKLSCVRRGESMTSCLQKHIKALAEEERLIGGQENGE